MSVLNRPMFQRAKGYADGGSVTSNEEEATAIGYLRSRGLEPTTNNIAKAERLLAEAQSWGPARPGMFERMPVTNDFESTPSSF